MNLNLVFVFKGKICKFYGNSTVLSKRSWSKKYNLCESWDIEDLVKAGKKAKVRFKILKKMVNIY